jgi:hypothetical protein
MWLSQSGGSWHEQQYQRRTDKEKEIIRGP